MKGFLTAKEVQERLGATRREFEQAVKDGRLKPIQTAHGKKRWFKESEINELIGEAA